MFREPPNTIGASKELSEPKPGTIQWQRLEASDSDNHEVYRLKTPEGWVIWVRGEITFVPDAKHLWKKEILEHKGAIAPIVTGA